MSAFIVAWTLPAGDRRTTEPSSRFTHRDPKPDASQSGLSSSTLASSTSFSWTRSTPEGAGAVGVTFGFGSSGFGLSAEDEHDASAMIRAVAIVTTSEREV